MQRILHKRMLIGDRVIRLAPGGIPRCAECGWIETHTHLFYDCHIELVMLFIGWWNACTGSSTIGRIVMIPDGPIGNH